MPRLMLIAAVWSLIAAPSLCRAGALTACCTRDEAPIAPPACCDGENQAPSDEPPGPAAERECGSCADVCRGVAKPAEDRGLADLVEPVQPWGGDAGRECLTVSIAVAYVLHDCILIGLCLPYPASNMPLRI